MNHNKKNPKNTLFAIQIEKITGGFEARARIATHTGHITITSRATKTDQIAGLIDKNESPRSAAAKDALMQAAQIALGAVGVEQMSPKTRFAIVSTQMVRELTDRAKAGDSEARYALRMLKNDDNEDLRKAVHAQRLFGDA